MSAQNLHPPSTNIGRESEISKYTEPGAEYDSEMNRSEMNRSETPIIRLGTIQDKINNTEQYEETKV